MEVRRQINRLEAAYLNALVVFDRTGAAVAEHGSTAAWVRAELHRSPTVASADVLLARDLADLLPATRAAMADGELSPAHAQLIASLKGDISDEALAAAEPHLVEWAAKATPKELRAVVSHVRHSYGPEKAARDEQDDYEARALHASATIGGMSGTLRCTPAGSRP